MGGHRGQTADYAGKSQVLVPAGTSCGFENLTLPCSQFGLVVGIAAGEYGPGCAVFQGIPDAVGQLRPSFGFPAGHLYTALSPQFRDLSPVQIEMC